jgi:GNAT superfamily N-acetyltransferase
VRSLLLAYAQELGVDLGFQGLAQELGTLPLVYAPPGGLWLASLGESNVGCVGLRSLDDTYAELKRLFALSSARGFGVGRALVETALGAARAAGFGAVRLDTLPTMKAAATLYGSLGFVPIPPYRGNPVPGARCLELAL